MFFDGDAIDFIFYVNEYFFNKFQNYDYFSIGIFLKPLLDVIQISVSSKRFNSTRHTFPVIEEYNQELFDGKNKRPPNQSPASLPILKYSLPFSSCEHCSQIF